jgi:hypothetical protein
VKLQLIVLIAATTTTLAQGTSSGLTPLRLPSSARMAALGEALVAEPSDLSSLSINPANLLRHEDLVILLSHNEWIQDLRAEHLSFGLPLSFGTVGFTISNTAIRDIEVRDRPGPAVASFTARSSLVQLSVAAPTHQQVVLGVSMKLLYEKMYVDEATGVALDVGLLYATPLNGLTAGLSVTNVGGTGALAAESVVLPRRLTVGASYRFGLEDVAFSVTSSITREERLARHRLATGIEAVFQRDFALRFGYQTGYDVRALSAGLGVRYGILTLDYAFVPFSYNLGTAHLFSIGFTISS